MRNWAYNVLQKLGIRTHRRFRLSLRAVALIGGLSAAFYVSVLLTLTRFDLALWFYLIVVVAAIVEFIFGDALADRSFPFDTERKLSLMNKRLGSETINTISDRLEEVIGALHGCDTTLVSGTVHIVTELTATADHRVRDGMLQLTDYVGPDGGRKGRITLINQGLIGRCARTGQVETVDFADEEDYGTSMVRDFGFTQQEASSHSKNGRSYIALPLLNDQKVVGVLYFFSTAPQVFPHAAEPANLELVAAEIVNYLRLAQLV